MTPLQSKTLAALQQRHHTHRSLMLAMGWKSTASTRRAIAALVRKGLVTVRPGARGFTVVPQEI